METVLYRVCIHPQSGALPFSEGELVIDQKYVNASGTKIRKPVFYPCRLG